MKELTCPSCRSTDFIHDVQPVDHGEQHYGAMKLELAHKFASQLINDKQHVTVSAAVCADCGYIVFYLAADSHASFSPCKEPNLSSRYR